MKSKEEFKFVPIRRKASEKTKKLNEFDKQLKEYRNKQKGNKTGASRDVPYNSNPRYNVNNGGAVNANYNQVVPAQQRNYAPPPNSNDLRLHQIYNTIDSFRDPRNLMLRAHELVSII